MKNSFKWSAIGTTINKVLSIIVFIFMARQLTPSDYGIVALLTILIGFAKVFTESGYKEAIIYFKIKDEKQLSSIFYLLFLLSLVFFIILNLFKNQLATLLMNGIDEYILYVSFILLLSPLKVVSLAKFEESMKFKEITYIEFISLLVSSLAGLFLAYSGFGVMSLIVMLIVNEFMLIFLFYFLSSWRLKLVFDFQSIKYIYNYSIHLISFTLVNFITENLDKLLISKYMGKADMGIYQRTQQLTIMPAMFISQAIGRVFFPYIISFKDDLEKVKELHIKTLQLIVFSGFPLLSLLIIFSDEFVLLLLSEKWKAMIPLLEIFAIMGMFQVIGFITVNLYKSLGYTKLQNKINLILKANVLISTVIGINFGIMGLIYALLSARGINFFVTQYFICKIISFNLKKLIIKLLPYLTFLVIYIQIFYYIKNNFLIIHNLYSLIGLSGVYLICYFGLGFILFKDIRKLVKKGKEC